MLSAKCRADAAALPDAERLQPPQERVESRRRADARTACARCSAAAGVSAAGRDALEAAYPVLRQRPGAPRGLFPRASLKPVEQTAAAREPSPVETDGEATNPAPRISSSSSSEASLPRGRARTREGRALARADQPLVRYRTLSRTEKSGGIAAVQGLVGRDARN